MAKIGESAELPPSLARPRRRRLAVLAAALAVALGCCLPGAWLNDWFRPNLAWEQPGPMQVLAGRDELWLFLEVERAELLRGKLVSAPIRTRPVRRWVVVVGRDGSVERFELAGGDGCPSLHRNFGRVFRLDDALYALDARDRSFAAWGWRGTRFGRLSSSETGDLLKEADLVSDPRAVFEPVLDAHSRDSGWEPAFTKTDAYWTRRDDGFELRERFRWWGLDATCAFEVIGEGPDATLALTVEGRDAPVPLYTLDPRRLPVGSRGSW